MTIKIFMPSLSPTMIEGVISKWLIKIGDKIKAGDIIAEIETDKATMEVEAVDEGTITHLIDLNSKPIPVNSVIGLIDGNEKDVIESNFDNKKTNKKDQSVKVISSINKVKKEENNENNENIKIFASPYVKKISKEDNIDLKNLKGSGPEGRIIKRDIVNITSDDDSNDILRKVEIIKPSNIRSIIANKTTETKKTIPHYYLSIESKVDNLISLRNKINLNNDYKISFNDLFVKALALAMEKNQDTNISWVNGEIHKYSSIDISIAVALKEGLVTPIIKDADKKGINEISLETKDLIDKANQNKLLAEEYNGGSITISNLGMYGIDQFSAIINPPQSSIIAIGKISKIPLVENEKIIIGHTMKSTLSVDHRCLDGSVAAKLLQDFNNIIENPFEIWVKSNDLKII